MFKNFVLFFINMAWLTMGIFFLIRFSMGMGVTFSSLVVMRIFGIERGVVWV